MMKITNQLSVLEACKGVIGGNLDWRAVANASGVTNPLEKNIKGQVLKLDLKLLSTTKRKTNITRLPCWMERKSNGLSAGHRESSRLPYTR